MDKCKFSINGLCGKSCTSTGNCEMPCSYYEKLDLKIFTENIEPEALAQIHTLMEQVAFRDCKVRIMPDVHAGAGCVIGFTADLGNRVIPNIVGVDIGCGMYCANLGKIDIDFSVLDSVIRQYIPSGRNVHEGRMCRFELSSLNCFRSLKDTRRLERSIGTLGGGNHFIEIDADSEGNKYLIIHTGSRNLGKQVAEYYQDMAISVINGKLDTLISRKREMLIDEYKNTGRRSEIQAALKMLDQQCAPIERIPNDLCYLDGDNRKAYLHDMEICQKFAVLNRSGIAGILIDRMGWNVLDAFETIHNYIDHDGNMVRKGAISAKAGERLLIPINMRDGCILGTGKGNPDWNYSAPHGAGRIMSRAKAKQTLTIDEYSASMSGIFTTSVSADTIDEAPMAYKPMLEIISNIGPTVQIDRILKPIYNFKA